MTLLLGKLWFAYSTACRFYQFHRFDLLSLYQNFDKLSTFSPQTSSSRKVAGLAANSFFVFLPFQ
jgi:hypothetical protein